jgi:hypothetical protein
MTSSGARASAQPPVSFDALSPRERQRLRLLALRYRVRRDTALRPLADVMFDLRLRHGVQLSMSQVMDLVGGTASRGHERSERGGEQSDVGE